ncbi:MAG: C39 family peptidase [Candidatus Doudnabacteria bacterium]|jgi:hypothetical protein
MPGKIKKYFYILLLVELMLSYIPAQVFAADKFDYSTSGVSKQIETYLCAPSAVDKKSTEVTTGTFQGLSNYQTYAATNNANSGDLFKCINQLYRFAIILSAVIGVFFIVIAGYIYMSADGNQESVDKAKNILVTTITSMVILMAGYLLLKAINPDLVQLKSIQPPSVQMDTSKWQSYQTLSQSFSAAEVKGCKSQTGTLENNYYHFSQCSGSWASTPYSASGQTCKESDGSASTIGTSGCGPTSLATALKNMGVNVDPTTIANAVVKNNGRVCGSGTSGAVLQTIAQSYGATVTNFSTVSDALKAVKSGGVVIAAMGPGIFTSGGHFIVIYGTSSDGKYLIADSGPRNITKASEADITASYKAGFQVKK